MNSQVFPPRLKSFILYQELDLYSRDPERSMWTVLLVLNNGINVIIFIFVGSGFDDLTTLIIGIIFVFLITDVSFLSVNKQLIWSDD